MHTSIRSLDIRDIGLGSSGFLELRIHMPEVVKLISINIRYFLDLFFCNIFPQNFSNLKIEVYTIFHSENRGGIQAAEFLEELISRASELVDVQAGYNLMPPESLNIICSSLKVSQGKHQ